MVAIRGLYQYVRQASFVLEDFGTLASKRDLSQTQTFFTLRTVYANIKQMLIEDSYAVFNVCKHL